MRIKESAFEPKVGAEARIELVSWHGKDAIRKVRIPKAYRSQDLDLILRSRRTKEEALVLHQAKLAGVLSPIVHFVDPVQCEIVMDYIKGTHLKDISNEAKETQRLYNNLGISIGMLHVHSIIHGDLTTKNILVCGDEVALIDFGLSFVSERLEDQADDIHLLKQALKSTNLEGMFKKSFEQVLDGYVSVVGTARMRAIVRQIQEIERRGRYARVD